ncbi:MAG: thiolase family protein [Alphaproteobacteria bacterium TMED89]|nr:acetyl-CoA C-acyltransferase [Rhodospirillaceae bacterium]RPH13711.1 MAG: thiolase family protein [Alphaproteobacteria bacterium TMED89]
MTQIVIAQYSRSAFHPAHKGALIKTRPDDMAAAVVKAVVDRADVDPSTIEDVILGNATPEGEQGLLMGRLVALRAGLPKEVGGATINRWCGSSMSAIHYAAGQIAMGAGDAFVAAGVESMTRVPMGGFNPMPNPQLMQDVYGVYMGMGETAENVAERYQMTRESQEAFAVESHKKAAAAQAAGNFKDEIVSVDGVDTDGCIRPDTNLEGLAGLKPAFSATGTVTAGTSSPLTDGAAATLVCSAEYAREHNLTPLAVIKSMAINGCDPDVMGLGPIGATRKALKRAGLEINDIDIIEINEAFASQSMACINDLGMDVSRVNLDGGAIALGHPLGATGARITGKAAALLKREGKKYALSTQCIGGGQGITTIMEAA